MVPNYLHGSPVSAASEARYNPASAFPNTPNSSSDKQIQKFIFP